VRDPESLQAVPRDGETLGEVMFRGNVVMKGYLKEQNREPRRRSPAAGFIPGDSRRHPSRRLYPAQGPLQGHHSFPAARIFPRSRSEDALYKHPARCKLSPWSPSPTRNGADAVRRSLELKSGATATARGAHRLVPGENLAAYKMPRATWCSAGNPRKRAPEKFKNSSCGIGLKAV